ncbi:hypothetical protein BGW80DRAFT_1293387 [Lactifluus volemus]|nr:hypothetical protein BGW80DRAFT_1293387 [Lactifluus volemus]
MQEMLRRLSEDIGRLEDLGRAQAQGYKRSIVALKGAARKWTLHNMLSSHRLPRRSLWRNVWK